MKKLYQCDKCERIHNLESKALNCESQPLQPLLANDSKVLYNQKECRIGPQNFINPQHIRYYHLFIKIEDTKDGAYINIGFVSEHEFTVL